MQLTRANLPPVLAVTAVLAGIASPAIRADETLRCGNALITVGMVGTQVVARCGQPRDKSVTEAARRTGRGGGRSSGAGAVHVEHWIYDRGYGQFPARLTFESGKLTSIELLTSR
jgi:hypothetical protein